VTDILEELRSKLESNDIHAVRKIGRAVGVSIPTKKKKEELIEEIIAIASDKALPAPKSTRGAPTKSNDYDFSIVEAVEKCRDFFHNSMATPTQEAKVPVENNLPENSPVVESFSDEKVYEGVLEFSDKFWFLRTQNMQISSMGDVFVHVSFVNRFRLKVGDYITCRAKRRKENECPGMTYLLTVNGLTPDSLRRVNFDGLVPCYPDERLTLEYDGCSLTERAIDLFSPIGCGQRALIVSPPKAGKTTMLKHIACALTKNHPDLKVIILLVDERPEEVTDIRRSVGGAEVVYSTFDKGDMHHIHTANLTLEYAKRQVEVGKDVVILMDSITRLTRAYNAVCNSGRTLSGGLDPQAIVEPKRFFGAARNVENGGSLTIIATVLVDTGSRLDDVIYEEFKSTGNMEIVLSRELAERRVFPAINIKSSGARKEELLLSETELVAASKLRSMLGRELNEVDLLSTMAKTKNNGEFCEKSETFLRVYRT
jgi:transcription termination factor Rho